MKLGRYFELIGGCRWDRFDTSYKQTVSPGAVDLSRVDELPSGRAAMVFKPATNGSLYFAWGKSFNPSRQSLSLAASNAGLAPEENETFEIGTKWNVLDERLSLSAALFQIEKTNARVPDPFDSAFNILGGNQRVRGFEIGAVGQITERWQIFFGYSFLNSRVVNSTLTATVGQPLANTPQHTLSLWSTYRAAVAGHRDRGRVELPLEPHCELDTECDNASDRDGAGLSHGAGDGEISGPPSRHRPPGQRLQHHEHALLRFAASVARHPRLRPRRALLHKHSLSENIGP